MTHYRNFISCLHTCMKAFHCDHGQVGVKIKSLTFDLTVSVLALSNKEHISKMQILQLQPGIGFSLSLSPLSQTNTCMHTHSVLHNSTNPKDPSLNTLKLSPSHTQTQLCTLPLILRTH